MNIFESLENLNVSEECFNDIVGIVEEIINERNKENRKARRKWEQGISPEGTRGYNMAAKDMDKKMQVLVPAIKQAKESGDTTEYDKLVSQRDALTNSFAEKNLPYRQKQLAKNPIIRSEKMYIPVNGKPKKVSSFFSSYSKNWPKKST